MKSSNLIRGMIPRYSYSMKNFSAKFSSTQQQKGEAHYLAVLKDHGCPAVSRAPAGNNIVIDHAKGCYVTDIHGRRFLDFQTGIGVANTGHCHPKVVDAVIKQVSKGIHLQQNCGISKPHVDLIEKLVSVAPKGISRFFFNCTGSEAVESAIKLARHETKRQNIIYFKGSFHGRSLTTLAITTSKYAYKVGYGPFPSGMHQAAYPYCVHCKCKPAGKELCCDAAIDSIEEMFKESSPASDTAAIIIEPVLGEGGYVLPPKGFMKKLRKLCDDHGILLIADEVQSGMGRTGKFWAVEHEDITPDILVFAKGIASGMVLSGIGTKPHMMLKSPAGSMGGTYGANAVSAAAAVATIDAIIEEDMLENAAARGEQLMEGLRLLAKKYGSAHILDVRGKYEGVVEIQFHQCNI